MRITKEKLEQKNQEVYGGKFDLSEVKEIYLEKEIPVICPKHGRFNIITRNFMNGSGCKQCKLDEKLKSLVERAGKIFGDLYIFDEFHYTKNNEPSTVICKKHGRFQKTPNQLLNGNGCLECFKEKKCLPRTDKTYFVNQAREVHGDTYGYDDFDFQGMHEKGMITCKIHGNFPMTPHAHITGKQGCPKCGILKRAKSRLKFNTETYKEEVKKIHGDKYILDEIEFTRLEDKIKVICPKHGPWYPTARSFRDGHGCPGCGLERVSNALSDTKEDFVRKAREVWGDLYGYDDFDYQGSDVPGKIWCYECNDYFWKAPNAHLSGHQGCQRCSQKNRIYRNNVEKQKETMIEKYGVPFSFQVEEVKEKIKQTNLERYGVENPTYNRTLYEESIKKQMRTTYEKYTKDLVEIEPLFTADEYKGIYNGGERVFYPFKCKKCGHIFKASIVCPRCVKCHPYSRSEGEIEMADYIESIYPGEVVYNDPSVLNNNGYNFDVYLPEEKIAFEYNGDYWHNRDDIKERDLKKKELADEAGIKIIYIWEHDWADNKDEMKKLIDKIIKE